MKLIELYKLNLISLRSMTIRFCSTRDENITRGEAECNIFIEGLAFFHMPWQTMQYFLYYTENPLNYSYRLCRKFTWFAYKWCMGIPHSGYCIVECLLMNHINRE